MCDKRLLKVLGEDANQPLRSHHICSVQQIPSGCSVLWPTVFFLCGLLAFGNLALQTHRKRQFLSHLLVTPKEKKEECMEAIYRVFKLELCGIQALNWLAFLLLSIT